MRTSWLVVLALAGCGKDSERRAASSDEAAHKEAERLAIEAENNAPIPPKAPAKPPKGQATVDIALTGAVEKKLSGAIGMCKAPFYEGRTQGASFEINTDELQLVAMALTDAELDHPMVTLNVRNPARSYVHKSKDGTVKLDREKSAELDVELQAVVGKESVHVKGTFTCNTP